MMWYIMTTTVFSFVFCSFISFYSIVCFYFNDARMCVLKKTINYFKLNSRDFASSKCFIAWPSDVMMWRHFSASLRLILLVNSWCNFNFYKWLHCQQNCFFPISSNPRASKLSNLILSHQKKKKKKKNKMLKELETIFCRTFPLIWHFAINFENFYHNFQE